MAAYLLCVDLFGLVLAVIGFHMAFRQRYVRSLFTRSRYADASSRRDGAGEDPLTYILRIAGIMVMIFGLVFAGMMTMVHMMQL